MRIVIYRKRYKKMNKLIRFTYTNYQSVVIMQLERSENTTREVVEDEEELSISMTIGFWGNHLKV